MARISGIDLPKNKRGVIGLTYIYGIGRSKAKSILAEAGIDENVNPSASFKLAEALIRADKQFDLMIFPSQRHGYTGKHGNYFKKLRWNYFVEHLLGEEPIWEIELEPEGHKAK